MKRSLKVFLRVTSFILLTLLALGVLSADFSSFNWSWLSLSIPLVPMLSEWVLPIDTKDAPQVTRWLDMRYLFRWPLYVVSLIGTALFAFALYRSTDLNPILNMWVPVLPLLTFGVLTIVSVLVFAVASYSLLKMKESGTRRPDEKSNISFGYIFLGALCHTLLGTLDQKNIQTDKWVIRMETVLIGSVAVASAWLCIGLLNAASEGYSTYVFWGLTIPVNTLPIVAVCSVGVFFVVAAIASPVIFCERSRPEINEVDVVGSNNTTVKAHGNGNFEKVQPAVGPKPVGSQDQRGLALPQGGDERGAEDGHEVARSSSLT